MMVGPCALRTRYKGYTLMLNNRWRKNLRNRQAGDDFKPPYGAADKSCGLSDKEKALKKRQVSTRKANESESLKTRRNYLR